MSITRPDALDAAHSRLGIGPCRHDSMRVDGYLDDCCLRCGADGYWHDGHQHDWAHPSGKLLFRLDHEGTNDA